PLKSSPENSRLWLEQADLAARAGDRKLALESLPRVQETKLDAQDRSRLRGIYADLGEYHSALAMLQGPLKSSPENSRLWLEQADLAAGSGDRKLALESLARVQTAKLDARERSKMRGIYANLGEYPAPLAMLQSLLKSSPDDAKLRLEQADLAARAGDRKLALESLARVRTAKLDAREVSRMRAIQASLAERQAPPAMPPSPPPPKNSPDESRSWLEQAELAARAGDRKSALESLARVQAFGRKEDRLRTAMIYQDLKMFGPELDLLRQLAKEQPSNARLFADMGVCHYLSGSTPEAIVQLKSSIKLDPDYLPAYITLGYLYTESRLHKEALDVYSAALARPPAPGQETLRKRLAEAQSLLLKR
ncbi:MAG: tetratricopeptide repeat protein, partial [Elusimicrobia bacterium]|nr:tetratricopeptide repeat protein [Elusimicrobiota bacterium]